MQREPEVFFHNTHQDEAVEADILQRIARLERFFDRIIGCRVVVDVPHKRLERGNPFQVRVELAVPGRDIYVSHDANNPKGQEPIGTTVKDTFDIVERELKKHVDKLRGEVKAKAHAEGPPSGTVIKIFEESGYGFIQAPDGREIYFHQNAVANGDFAKLTVGASVTYTETSGEMGPQATMVAPTS